MTKNESLTYESAGVDIDKGNQLIERIKPAAEKTKRPEQLTGLGGFGGLFAIPTGYQEPVLVSGTDGVGTKIKLAIEHQRPNGIGIDLVAMCVNDIVVQGADPLFFLDYYATGHLDLDVATNVISGIARGCEIAGCALIGGETAEMPGMYQNNDYDLAGFAVGIVEKKKIINGMAVQSGDAIIGIASSGPHANGYSLIRKIIERNQITLDSYLKSYPLIDHLIEPTRIYSPLVMNLIREFPIHALAHITGGGLTENIPRVLPPGLQAVINPASWPLPDIFEWLQTQGNITNADMRRTFNCGIGMIAILPAGFVESVIDRCFDLDIAAWEIGHIQSTALNNSPSVFYQE